MVALATEGGRGAQGSRRPSQCAGQPHQGEVGVGRSPGGSSKAWPVRLHHVEKRRRGRRRWNTWRGRGQLAGSRVCDTRLHLCG